MCTGAEARFTRSGEEADHVFRAPGPDFRAEILHQPELRSFLAAAHDEGIVVEALDGAPEYAAKKYHFVPLAVVDAVIAFNGEGGPRERFDGVHFDNEPYLLAGWHLPSLREQIMNEFLELNVECQRRIRSRSGMAYGIDIPFWWQSPDPETGSAIAPASLDGVRKAASFHVIDRLDSVGIMNYRTASEGADGLLAHGLTLLEYAEKARGARVFMGVETITEPPADVWFATGLPRKESGEALNTRAEDLLYRSRINGFRIHVLDDGAHLHFGIGIPSRPSPDQDRAVRETMGYLAERLGASGANIGNIRTEEILRAAFRKIAGDPEWRDPKTRPIPLPEGMTGFSGFQAKNILLPKISFGYKTIADMRRELAAAEEEFGAHEPFAGMAIHHYDSYRKMVDSAGRADTDR